MRKRSAGKNGYERVHDQVFQMWQEHEYLERVESLAGYRRAVQSCLNEP